MAETNGHKLVRAARGNLLGRWYGSYRAVQIVGRTGSTLRYRLKCGRCGAVRMCLTTHLRRIKPCTCDASVEPTAPEIEAGDVAIDAYTPWELDDVCWYVVACHPDGLTLAEIGELLGVTRERVRQIETAALEKLRAVICGQVAFDELVGAEIVETTGEDLTQVLRRAFAGRGGMK